MNKGDEEELVRLTEMLRKINDQIDSDSRLKEPLEKAGIALILIFLRGLRPELKAWHNKMGVPLNDVDRQRLRSSRVMGQICRFWGACRFLMTDSFAQMLRIQLPRAALADYNGSKSRLSDYSARIACGWILYDRPDHFALPNH